MFISKDISRERIIREVERISFRPFNYHDNWYDLQWFKYLINVLFPLGDKIVLLGMRENEFYEDQKSIDELRDKLPESINQNGIFEIVEKRDEKRHSSISVIDHNDYTFDIILNCWKYYEVFSFFETESNHVKDIRKKGREMFSFNTIHAILNQYSTCIVGKTLDDQELRIDHLLNQSIDVNKIASFKPSLTP